MGISPADFVRTKQAIMLRHRRGFGADLHGLSIDCGYLIEQSPLIAFVRVKKPGEGEHMLVAQCRRKLPMATPEQVASELERIWMTELRSLFGEEAHMLVCVPEEVSLEFIALTGGRYVNGLLVVDLRPYTPRIRNQQGHSQRKLSA